MNKNRYFKLFQISFLAILVIGLVPTMLSFANQDVARDSKSKKINIAYIGSSDGISESVSFLKKNYSKDVELIKVKYAEQIHESIEIVVALQSEFVKIQSDEYYEEIYSRIKSGLLSVLLLEEDAITIVKAQKENYEMSVNLTSQEETSNLISTENEIITFQYHIQAEYQKNGVEVTERYEAIYYDSYINRIKQYLDEMIDNVEKSSYNKLKTASGDWIKKKELIGSKDYGKFEVYTRFEIFKSAYTDVVINKDYYRIDSYVHHYVKTFAWNAGHVGPWIGKRIIYADADAYNQELYLYEPTGTVGTTTVGYSVSIIINTAPSASVVVGYSHSWSKPQVTITDTSSMINNYAKWTESFSGPNYFWWPIMGWCTPPATVSRSSFYSLPSLVVRVPTGEGLKLPQLQATYKTYEDRDFWTSILFIHYTRTITTYTAYTTWYNIFVDRSSGGGGGGGCPILSVYDGEQYAEEGLLDIHASEDVTTNHILTTTPQSIDGKYLLRLKEHHQTFSHLDQVRLLATLENGNKIVLPLLSANHSANGDITSDLLLNDDVRTEIYGADHNNGESESIDLEFLVPKEYKIQELTFLIEGYNYIVK
ncbi:hypothetical protein LCGC14_1392440 [marine sediment metagenome]|uniref:Uncharacterized protein n=1 Tax=marine sediment metagenome TaxID=412755 RepID=A0A0F9JZH9_9ZZZZ|nr:hypothetical protein [bacterium]